MSIFEKKMQPEDKIIQNDGYKINMSQLERIATPEKKEEKETPPSSQIVGNPIT